MRAIIAGVRSLRASEDDFGRASMKGKTVAILESRMRDHIASLVRKYGGTPFSAPALAEIPDVDPAHIDELIRDWNSAPPDIFIFQTGVGTHALFAATDLLGVQGEDCSGGAARGRDGVIARSIGSDRAGRFTP